MPATPSPPSVLLVDPHRTFSVGAESLFKQVRVHSRRAESVAEARSLPATPQIVFFHCAFSPELDAALHGWSDRPDVAWVAVMDFDDPDIVGRAMASGVYQCLRYPVAPVELLSVYQRAREWLDLRGENVRLQIAAVQQSPAPESTGRPERAAMERAALARVTVFVSHALAKSSMRVLERALSRPASSETLSDVVSEALIQDGTNGPWAAALLRGAEVQKELLAQAGGTLTVVEVGTLLGITRAAVDKRRRQGALLAIKLPSGDMAYPAAQFRNGDVLPGLADVLGAFRIRDPWMQLDTLLSADEALGGHSGFEALARGDVEQVKNAVSSFGEQGL